MANTEDALRATGQAADRVRRTVDAALAAGRKLTDSGRGIDEHQVHSERLAYLATEAVAAEALLAYAREASSHDPFAVESAAIFTAMVAARARAAIGEHMDEFGVAPSLMDETVDAPEQRDFVRAGLADRRIEALGAEVVRRRGTPDAYLASDLDRATRDAVRSFAREEVAPVAQQIHLNDDLVPESILGKMSELVDLFVLFTYFGLFSLWAFYHKMYLYGHELDPTSAIKVDPFTPPIFGHMTMANFEVYSYPQLGSYFMGAVPILLLLAMWLSRRAAQKETAVR